MRAIREPFRVLWQQADDGGGEAPSQDGAYEEPPAGEAMGDGGYEEEVYVEGIDPPPEEENQPDPQDLQKQNQELQQQLEQLKQQADLGQNLQQSISQLGENLQQPRRTDRNQGQAQAQPQQQPGESEEEFAKRVRENFYDDPYKVLNEFQYRKLQPFIAQMVNNNLTNSRRFLQVDPNKKQSYNQYQDEIEQEVQGMPYQEKMNDPQVYDKAYERVMARHMDDIIEQKVQERMDQQEANKQPPPQTPQSESSQYKPAGKPKKSVKKLTRQEAMAADAKGIPRGTYYDYLVGKGLKS